MRGWSSTSMEYSNTYISDTVNGLAPRNWEARRSEHPEVLVESPEICNPHTIQFKMQGGNNT